VIKCRPLTFSSITNLPKLTPEITNFLQAAWSGQCELVEFVIKNTSDSNLRDLVPVVDHAEVAACDWHKGPDERNLNCEGAMAALPLRTIERL
jgi:hypothetical protein